MTEIPDLLRARRVWLIARDRVADEQVMNGLTDTPIRASARGAYDDLRRLLPEPEQTVRYQSPTRRAEQTAARIYPHHEWENNEQLGPRGFGDWERKSWGDVRTADPRRAEAFWNDYANSRAPGGESLVDVSDRVELFLTSLANRSGWHNVVAVTHPDVIRAVVCRVLDVRLKQAIRIHVEPLSLCRLSLSWEAWQLDSLNVRA